MWLGVVLRIRSHARDTGWISQQQWYSSFLLFAPCWDSRASDLVISQLIYKAFESWVQHRFEILDPLGGGPRGWILEGLTPRLGRISGNRKLSVVIETLSSSETFLVISAYSAHHFLLSRYLQHFSSLCLCTYPPHMLFNTIFRPLIRCD